MTTGEFALMSRNQVNIDVATTLTIRNFSIEFIIIQKKFCFIVFCLDLLIFFFFFFWKLLKENLFKEYYIFSNIFFALLYCVHMFF